VLAVEERRRHRHLGDDQGSRAIGAACARPARRRGPRVAQAYDPRARRTLSILAVRVVGLDPAALTQMVKSSWLAATGAGVTEDEVTLGGRTFTRIDYGDEGTVGYLIADNDIAIVIETADPALAAQAAAALP